MRETRTSGSMSGTWKRSMERLRRHRQTKGPETARPLLNHRATSRLYVDLARAPREFESMAIPTQSDRAIAWLATAREWLKQQPPRGHHERAGSQTGGWRTPPCIRLIESTVLPDGVRHRTYYVLARFYATTGMAKQEAIDRLREIVHRHPIRDPDYVERVVHNGRAHPGFAGCPNPILAPYCDRTRCLLAQTRRREDG